STLWLKFSSNGLGDARRPSWSWLCHRRVVGDVSSPPNEREFASTLQHQNRHILPLAGSRKSSVFRLLSFTKRVWTGIIPWRDARCRGATTPFAPHLFFQLFCHRSCHHRHRSCDSRLARGVWSHPGRGGRGLCRP